MDEVLILGPQGRFGFVSAADRMVRGQYLVVLCTEMALYRRGDYFGTSGIIRVRKWRRLCGAGAVPRGTSLLSSAGPTVRHLVRADFGREVY
jgi:hypothetical protein